MSQYITAVSTQPLPSGPVIRERVVAYLGQLDHPALLFQDMSTLMLEGLFLASVPQGANRSRSVKRRTYRADEAHADRLKTLSDTLGLPQTTIIAVALAWQAAQRRSGPAKVAAKGASRGQPVSSQMSLFDELNGL